MILVIWASVISLVALAAVYRRLDEFFRRYPHAWRWVSGNSLDGVPRTNATWTRRSHGDKPVLHPSGYAHPWHHLPRLYRAGIRDGAMIALFFLLFGLARHRFATLLTLAAVAAGAALFLGRRAVLRMASPLAARAGPVLEWSGRRAQPALAWSRRQALASPPGRLAIAAHARYRHQWYYVRPLRRTLAHELGAPPRRLAIEPDRSRVEVGLPEHLTNARALEAVTGIVVAKLGIEAPDVAWHPEGRTPFAVFTKSAPPPLSVTFADIKRDIEAARPSQVILGLGKPIGGKRQVISTDIDSETPMTAASMTTGDGKSTLARNFVAQLAHNGAFVVCLDYKWFSHMWLDGLRNVCYARTPQEIHEVLCWLAYDDVDADGNIVRESELTRRKRVNLAAERSGVAADVGPRIVILSEEGNATVKVLKRLWRRIGSGPCPSLEALDEIGATGRQLKVNVFYIAQRLSAKASGADGSADARENIGAIILKDPTEATWKMLAGGHAQPPASGHKGRYQLVTRKEVREFQGAFWADDEAREFATSGIVAVPRDDMPLVTRPALVSAGVRREATGGMEAPDLGLVSTVSTELPAGGTVKLADMVAAGLFVTIAAARRRSTRDPLFPRPVGGDRYTGHTYAAADIYQYLAAKEKAKR